MARAFCRDGRILGQLLRWDGLGCGWKPNGLDGGHEGRWLIRTLHAVFDPSSANGASGSRAGLGGCFRLSANPATAGGE